MLKPTLAAAAIVLSFAAGTVHAQDVTSIATGIPATVTEVTTGGAWTKGEQNGAFRAIVVMSGEKEPQVNVFVQLLAFEKDTPTVKVLKTTPVKEVVEKKLQNAFVNFDAETEGKATLIITSYDPEKDADNSLYAEVNADGAYTLVDAPKEEPDTADKKQ